MDTELRMGCFPLFASPDATAVTRLVLGLRREAGRVLGAEAEYDWEQEARLLLWLLRGRLAGLPEGSRLSYTRACLRRRYSEFFQREQRDRHPTALTEALVESRCALAPAEPAAWREVRSAVAMLPPHEADLVTWHYFEGLTDPEIACRLRTTPAAAKARRARILAKLRRMLQRAGSERLAPPR